MNNNLKSIVSINIGTPKMMDYKGNEVMTGINKVPINEPVYLRKLNFDGDAQADLIHHGGEDKAVCVYPFEHYQYWEEKLNRKLEYAAFGENLTVQGMCEYDVSIGDILQIGEAIVQVSQPRQPCYKLAAKYNVVDLPVQFEKTGYTGYYVRVLKEGWVDKNAIIKVVERHPKQMTVEFLNQIMHHDKNNVEAIKEILSVKELSNSWRETFTKRLSGSEVDTKERLEGKK